MAIGADELLHMQGVCAIDECKICGSRLLYVVGEYSAKLFSYVFISRDLKSTCVSSSMACALPHILYIRIVLGLFAHAFILITYECDIIQNFFQARPLHLCERHQKCNVGC